MARPIVLSNGSMLVGLNRYGLVHDFFYPYIGLENHDTARALRHRIGVYIDGQFSWLDDDSWKVELDYLPDTLIGQTTAHHEGLNVTLEFTDAVDHDHDVFMRHISVTNNSDQDREIKLMLHQIFNISNTLNGDTAQYIPQEKAILHYSGYRNFIIKAHGDNHKSFDQFSVGLSGIEGKDGTYVDAEDGKLEGNPVEHGRVDSTIACHLQIEANSKNHVFYWVSAGNTREAALLQSRLAGGERMLERLNNTAQHWKKWLQTAQPMTEKLSEDQRIRFNKSLLLVKSHIDRRGGIIASSDTAMLNYARDAYTYCWPRDSVYALLPLVRLGYKKEVVQFFEFCRLGLQQAGYLMHKYQPDGAVGSSWHPYIHEGREELPIQEDETAAVIYLMREYYQASNDAATIKRFFGTLIKPMADFMCGYVDSDTGLPHASYDLWEERFATSTYTVALTQCALRAAAELADIVGATSDSSRWELIANDIQDAASRQLFNDDKNYFYKSTHLNSEGHQTFDDTVDSASLFGAWAYGLFDFDDERIQKSVDTLIATFEAKGEFKGIPRYLHDPYNASHPEGLGNPWIITSLWLAQYYINAGKKDMADTIINWVEGRMMPSGVLPEQFDPSDPERPVSVAPLVWSQAEYLSTLILRAKNDHQGHLPANEQGGVAPEKKLVSVKLLD